MNRRLRAAQINLVDIVDGKRDLGHKHTQFRLEDAAPLRGSNTGCVAASGHMRTGVGASSLRALRQEARAVGGAQQQHPFVEARDCHNSTGSFTDKARSCTASASGRIPACSLAGDMA